jgi:peptide deformylase
VKVKFLDYNGNPKEIEVEGYMARGVLHENDHLDGITMPDRLSTVKKDLFLRQLAKHAKMVNITNHYGFLLLACFSFISI